MKLCLLIAAVISGCLCGTEFTGVVLGNLTCPEPFTYIVSLWEEDNSSDDFVTSHTGYAQTGKANYHISGSVFDAWFESYVEPFFIVEHTCGQEGTKYACLCVKFDPKCAPFEEIVNIDFKSTTLKRCDECDAAELKRVKEQRQFRQYIPK